MTYTYRMDLKWNHSQGPIFVHVYTIQMAWFCWLWRFWRSTCCFQRHSVYIFILNSYFWTNELINKRWNLYQLIFTLCNWYNLMLITSNNASFNPHAKELNWLISKSNHCKVCAQFSRCLSTMHQFALTLSTVQPSLHG